MGCTPVKVGDATVLVCSRGGRRKERCGVACCPNPHEFLCDWMNEGMGKMCDKRLCGKCRTQVGNKDYCPIHAKRHREAEELPKRQGAL